MVASSVVMFKSSVPNTIAQMRTRVDSEERVNGHAVRGPWCECGRPRQPLTQCCDRCAFLDGLKTTYRGGRPAYLTALVVDTLRDDGELTFEELRDRVDVDKRQLMRELRRLLTSGRIAARETDVVAYDTTGLWKFRGRRLTTRLTYRLCAR